MEHYWKSKLVEFALETLPPDRQGEIYCARFEHNLACLQEQGMISGWRKTEYGSEEDVLEGIDYWLETPGEEIPFGVTSTYNNKKKHRKKHPRIPQVYIRQRGQQLLLRPDEIIRKEIIHGMEEYRQTQ